jgi:probable rRNA maturation factor
MLAAPVIGDVLHIVAPPRERRAVAWLRRDLRGFLGALAVARPVELSLVLTNDRGIAALNRRHRGIDAATDVLSFPQVAAPGSRRLLGDLVISVQTARREARTQGLPLRQELRRYAAHGLLHLLGHDHEEPAQAGRMARLERKILRADGLIVVAAKRDIGGRKAGAARRTKRG